MKYFSLIPGGGFNDILSQIYFSIEYCIKFKRILLINTVNTDYNINFSDYFTINLPNIIYDNTEVQKILSENCNASSKYLHQYIEEILKNKIEYIEDIVFYHSCGGRGDNYVLFHFIQLKPILVDYCIENYNKIPKPYMAIHIRNKEDLIQDYKSIVYEKNKDLIHSQSAIYLATDDNTCIDYFRNCRLNVFNFTTFPEGEYYNLHMQNGIDYDLKFKDMISDMCICALANGFISESKGLFTNLCRGLYENKYILQKQFGLEISLPIIIKEPIIFGFLVEKKIQTVFGNPNIIVTKSILGLVLNIELGIRELTLQEKNYENLRRIKKR
jgi:hypothetical protein